jgi:hypothetical protein
MNFQTHIIINKNNCDEIYEYILRIASECKVYMSQSRTAQSCEKRKVL